MSAISTHVLDAVLGSPARGIGVRLERQAPGGWIQVGQGQTDSDGRCRDLGHDGAAGVYRITFAVSEYFRRSARKSIYPEICVTFEAESGGKYHIPLLLSDNSYTTYRGS